MIIIIIIYLCYASQRLEMCIYTLIHIYRYIYVCINVYTHTTNACLSHDACCATYLCDCATYVGVQVGVEMCE